MPFSTLLLPRVRDARVLEMGRDGHELRLLDKLVKGRAVRSNATETAQASVNDLDRGQLDLRQGAGRPMDARVCVDQSSPSSTARPPNTSSISAWVPSSVCGIMTRSPPKMSSSFFWASFVLAAFLARFADSSTSSSRCRLR